MNLPYKYTKKERKSLLNSLKILIDTREKKNDHIIKYLKNKNIPYKSKKLNSGDYSFLLPANEELGIMRDIYFNDQITIERKASLDELSGNFTQNRTQFENELIRSNDNKFILMIENETGYSDIINHKYRTNYNPKSFVGTLHTFRHRYNADLIFINKSAAGNFIYYTFYYWLREFLK